MTPFVERIIFDRLTDGLQPFLDDPKLFERFLINGGLTAVEAANARTYFEGDALADPVIEPRPPHPIMGYARPGGPFPAWAITLGTEDTGDPYLGDEASSLDDEGNMFVDEEGNLVDCKIRRWNHRYDVFTYTDHGDVCLYYYQLAKHILVSGLTIFQAADLDNFGFSGAELAPDPRYLPPNIYVRRFSITLQADQDYSLSAADATGRRVSAVVSDDEALSGALTPVQVEAIEAIRAGITTYFEGDED